MNPTPDRSLTGLLAAYADSHRHPHNEVIHFVCVPAIVFSVLGLLWALHPLLAVGLAAASLGYYFRLSVPLAWGMVLLCVALLGLLAVLPQAWVGRVSLGVFVAAWVGQSIGHKIEGKKPSFLDDLRFLLIGPLFVFSFLYRRLKIAF